MAGMTCPPGTSKAAWAKMTPAQKKAAVTKNKGKGVEIIIAVGPTKGKKSSKRRKA